MNYPQILYTNLNSYTFSSSVASNDINNLKNYYPDSVWQSSVTTDHQYLYITLGFATDISTFIAHNTNMSSVMSSGNIKLQYANDQNFTSGVTTLVTLSVSSNVHKETFGSVNKQYFRIWYSGSVNTYPYIGNLFLGTPLTFTYAEDWGRKSNYVYNTTEAASISGRILTSGQNTIGRHIQELNFSLQNETFKTNFVNFIRDNRKRPFYYTDSNSVTRLVLMEGDYQPIEVIKWNLNSLKSLKLKTLILESDSVQTNIIYGIPDNEIITSVT